ncbi:hypothetical protein BGX34_004881, partial [Mortierella sp. NVP85]
MEEPIKTAFFGNVPHASPIGSLSPEQALELANIYLENSSKTVDPSIALVLCHDTDMTLYQAKRHIKPSKNPKLAKRIATTYISLGHMLTDLNQAKGAQASFRRAKKLGATESDLVRSIDTGRTVESLQEIFYSIDESNEVPSHIFAENIRPPTARVKLPDPDMRLDNTPQLVCCLALLKMAPSSDVRLEPIALKWMETIEKDKDEQERLHSLAKDVVKAFKKEGIKDAKVVAEV